MWDELKRLKDVLDVANRLVHTPENKAQIDTLCQSIEEGAMIWLNSFDVGQFQGPLKVFYWDKVLEDYGFGIAISYARSVDHARILLMKRMIECTDYRPGASAVSFGIELLAAEPQVFTDEAAFYLHGSS